MVHGSTGLLGADRSCIAATSLTYLIESMTSPGRSFVRLASISRSSSTSSSMADGNAA